MERLSEEKRQLIRKRLIEGAKISDIVTETGVSRKTVSRYKKETPINVLRELNDEDDIKDAYTCYSTTERKYVEKIKKEVDLYEDEIEGWVYHLSEDDMIWRTSGLWWSAIVYPESAPKDWTDKLRAQGFRIAISPLHDKDVWSHDSPRMVTVDGKIIEKGERYKAGSRKKAHWHVIIVSDTRMSYPDVDNTIRKITNGPHIQKCRSLRNAYDYFLHINAPEKYQGYDKKDIQVYNGFRLEPNKYEQGMLQDEILRTIKEQELITMDALIDYYIGQPEYIMILSAKPGIFTSYVNGLWKRKNPEGSIKQVVAYTKQEYDEIMSKGEKSQWRKEFLASQQHLEPKSEKLRLSRVPSKQKQARIK